MNEGKRIGKETERRLGGDWEERGRNIRQWRGAEIREKVLYLKVHTHLFLRRLPDRLTAPPP